MVENKKHLAESRDEGTDPWLARVHRGKLLGPARGGKGRVRGRVDTVLNVTSGM